MHLFDAEAGLPHFKKKTHLKKSAMRNGLINPRDRTKLNFLQSNIFILKNKIGTKWRKKINFLFSFGQKVNE
jgi:hypothetical protein